MWPATPVTRMNLLHEHDMCLLCRVQEILQTILHLVDGVGLNAEPPTLELGEELTALEAPLRCPQGETGAPCLAGLGPAVDVQGRPQRRYKAPEILSTRGNGLATPHLQRSNNGGDDDVHRRGRELRDGLRRSDFWGRPVVGLHTTLPDRNRLLLLRLPRSVGCRGRGFLPRGRRTRVLLLLLSLPLCLVDLLSVDVLQSAPMILV
mmetsp:Transcript_4480/g.9774  ORF Transcript_4480/g.9774 Transcript_4480/m.9774 type:complete len:206 (+) Transcript_4480:1390-2007(+)